MLGTSEDCMEHALVILTKWWAIVSVLGRWLLLGALTPPHCSPVLSGSPLRVPVVRLAALRSHLYIWLGPSVFTEISTFWLSWGLSGKSSFTIVKSKVWPGWGNCDYLLKQFMLHIKQAVVFRLWSSLLFPQQHLHSVQHTLPRKIKRTIAQKGAQSSRKLQEERP